MRYTGRTVDKDDNKCYHPVYRIQQNFWHVAAREHDLFVNALLTSEMELNGSSTTVQRMIALCHDAL
jgi:hypothetical protein